MDTIIANILVELGKPGTKEGAVVGLIAWPIIKMALSPVLSWLTKYALSGTAKITPLVAQGTKAACLWALTFPLVRSIIAANPKACEALIDTLGNCASAIILTVQVTVDAQIAAAGLQQAPDAPK
jgi:hypothetical protein